MDELEAAKAFLLFLQSEALDEFRWDLDFRAAVEGALASNIANEGQDHLDTHDLVEWGADIADEMARVRAERRAKGR